MSQAPSHECVAEVETLRKLIHARTFGRLHDLSVTPSSGGRFFISAIAHSRVVGQLAEWAVLEQLAPEDVDLSIRVHLSSPSLVETQK